MKKTLIITLIWFLIDAPAMGQFAVSIGYNAGCFTIPQRNFEILEYSYRNVIPRFKVPNFLYGASLGFRIENDNTLAELLFSNKKMTTNTYQYIGSDGLEYDYKLKMRLRTINFGGAYGTEYLKVGVSMDAGRLVAMKKNGLSSDEPKWENYYNMNTFFGGFTFFMPIRLSILEIRPYYQMSWFVDTLWNGVDFTHRSSNMGVNINLVLSK